MIGKSVLFLLRSELVEIDLLVSAVRVQDFSKARNGQ